MKPRLVQLRPMSDEEFSHFLDTAPAAYARDKVLAGNWPTRGAQERARAEFFELLPLGLQTPDQFLYRAIDETGEPCGHVWICVQREGRVRTAYLYDIGIDKTQRRKGLGAATLQAAEAAAAGLGAQQLGLHVFWHNALARRLYEKAGYLPTNLNMMKVL